jgi:hypothetical protein
MALDTKRMKKKKKTPSMTKRIRDVKRLLAKVRKRNMWNMHVVYFMRIMQHECRILWMINYVK